MSRHASSARTQAMRTSASLAADPSCRRSVVRVLDRLEWGGRTGMVRLLSSTFSPNDLGGRNDREFGASRVDAQERFWTLDPKRPRSEPASRPAASRRGRLDSMRSPYGALTDQRTHLLVGGTATGKGGAARRAGRRRRRPRRQTEATAVGSASPSGAGPRSGVDIARRPQATGRTGRGLESMEGKPQTFRPGRSAARDPWRLDRAPPLDPAERRGDAPAKRDRSAGRLRGPAAPISGGSPARTVPS